MKKGKQKKTPSTGSMRYDQITPLDAKFERYIKTRIIPLIPLNGYKLKKKRFIALRIIASLWFAELRKTEVADSRNNSKNGIRIAIWDLMISAGFANCIWLGNEYSGFVSRYKISNKLKGLLSAFDENKPLLNYNLKRNTQRKIPTRHALIVVQTGKKDLATGKQRPKHKQRKPLPLNKYSHGIIKYLNSIEDKIENFNRSQLKHTFRFPINPCVKFIHSEKFGRYGMLHSWSILSFQKPAKKERQLITIDGEQTLELDFSGYFIRQYYHYRGIEPIRADIYQPEKILKCYSRLSAKRQKLMRDFIKKATILCLNNANRTKAYFAIENEFLKPSKKELKRKYDEETQQNLKNKRIRRKILFKIEAINLWVLLNRILKLHKHINVDFFKPELYALTMSISGYAMLDILQEFVKKDKAVLPIHDSVIVKISDVDFARETMTKIYKKYHPKDKFTGFSPVIKQSKKSRILKRT